MELHWRSNPIGKVRNNLPFFKESAFNNSTTKQSVQNIPSDSLFAKIKIGMGRKQVTDLIGHHSDMHTFSTGKIWIPFYFGSDTVRTVYYYKGKGRILFSRNGRVMKIDYDPSEDGYK
jgi:hypothetical protein